MQTGRVKWFNDAKGYGFIEDALRGDVFVHYSVIDTEGFRTLREGEAVRYETQETDKGLSATLVQRAPDIGSIPGLVATVAA